MTPEQCRAARELLGWTDSQLARQCGRGCETIRYFEAGRGQPKPPTVAAIRAALEAAGVEFIAEEGASAGVRLRKDRGGCMTPGQCRAARGLLGWSRDRLAALADTSPHLLKRFESMQDVPMQPSVDALRRALEAAGIEFTNGDAPGVRTRKGGAPVAG